jgi:hypothetical protein
MSRINHLTFRPTDEKHNRPLRDLLAKANLHAAAESKVLAGLPESLAPHCRFVSYFDGDLTVSATSSVTASQIRMRQSEILQELRQTKEFEFAWRLKVKVAPPRFQSQPTARKEPLTKENARLLKEEAGHTKDEGLRQVLEKLSRHVRD